VAETGALSVWERPTRVILAGLTLGGAWVVHGLGWAVPVVVAGSAAGAVLGAVAVVQLGLGLRRALA
jgi:CDP-diacylglycerol--glycerol-3-phosphate 3-phosphatidyltransferase